MKNIDPALWGPSFWKMLHTVAFAFPDNPTQEQCEAVKQLFYCLKELLPCNKCRGHYTDYLDQHPIEDACMSKESLSKYVYDFHQAVNERLGKSYEQELRQVEQEYTQGIDGCDSFLCGNTVVWLVLIVLFVSLLVYFFFFNRK